MRVSHAKVGDSGYGRTLDLVSSAHQNIGAVEQQKHS